MSSFAFNFHLLLCLISNLLPQPTPVTGGGPHHNSSNPASENKELITTNHLIEVMQHLTVHPGKFDVLITPLVDTFSCWLGDEDKVSYIVNAIVEQVSCN